MRVHNGFLIKKICEIMGKNANSSLQAHDLTVAQLHILMILNRTEGRTLSLKELERFFHVAQSTAAGTVCRLEKKGLIESFSDVEDRRIKQVRLTALGEERCRESTREMQEAEQRLTSRLTPEEREEFNRLLRIVYETIR